MIANSSWEISLFMKETIIGIFFNKSYLIFPIFAILICSYISMCLIYFFLFHIFLIKNGLTTIEYIKEKYKEEKNPYNQGFLRNIYNVFCFKSKT